MTQYEGLSITFAAIAVVVNIVLFLVFFLQLRALKTQVRLSEEATERDHARRRQQATVDFYMTTLEKRTELRHTLPYDRNADAIREYVTALKDESETEALYVTDYLTMFEMLAGGVNMGIYDLEVIDRLAGSRLRAIYNNYLPWIDQRRRMFDSPSLYCELESLSRSLEARRATKFSESRAQLPS